MASIHVSSLLDVRIDDRHLLGVVTETIESLDAVHTISTAPPAIPVTVSPSIIDYGLYRHLRNGAPVAIVLNQTAPQPRITLLHEIGHYLDHQAIGVPPAFGSETEADLGEWQAVLIDSEAFRRFLYMWLAPPVPADHPAGPYAREVIRREIDEFLKIRECFARTYAQFIAAESGDPNQNREVGELRSIAYPAQWMDNDFRPLREEIKKLFKRMGWM